MDAAWGYFYFDFEDWKVLVLCRKSSLAREERECPSVGSLALCPQAPPRGGMLGLLRTAGFRTGLWPAGVWAAGLLLGGPAESSGDASPLSPATFLEASVLGGSVGWIA